MNLKIQIDYYLFFVACIHINNTTGIIYTIFCVQ